MNVGLDYYCVHCFRARDFYSTPPLPRLYEQSRQWGSTSYGTAGLGRSAGKADIDRALPTSEGASQKSGSPVHIRHDVTPEESSISLSKIAKHAHGQSERELSLKVPVDETQNHKESDKSAIAGDEISIPEVTYEQWIAADILRDDYGDTRATDDVEQGYIDGPPSDPESDFDSFLRSLTEPRNGEHSSGNPARSEQTKTKVNRGSLLPPVIYMLLVRVCGLVTRLFEPNPLPGRTRIRWRCVSCSRYVLLMQKWLFI